MNDPVLPDYDDQTDWKQLANNRQLQIDQLRSRLEEALNRNPRMIYPALQAAASDLHQVFAYFHSEEAGPSDVINSAERLLLALYDAKLATKPSVEVSS